MLIDNKQIRAPNESFNGYMMSALERSSNFSRTLEQRSYYSIQIFMAIFTALVGAGVAVATSVTDEFLRWSIITLIVSIICGIGILTYMWILVSLCQQIREVPLRFFLEKYFRDMEPDLFEKYGLSRLLGPYSRVNENKYFMQTQFASYLSLTGLGILSSCLLGFSCYTGLRIFIHMFNPLPSIGIGLLCLALMIIVWRSQYKAALKSLEVAQEILQKHYSQNLRVS